MRWPWTRPLDQIQILLYEMEQRNKSQQEMLHAKLDALSLGMRALLEDLADRKKIAHDEESKVGKTWVMSPGEQAQQEAQLLKESRTRRLKRQSGSDL